MNEQQLEIIRNFGKGQAVVAGAGCGKTTTLVAKCVSLVRNQPDARFCAVSFTEKSVRDLKESLKKGFLKEGFTQDVVQKLDRHHWIKTIHGLCLSLVQEFPLESGLSGGETLILQDDSDQLWNRSLYVLWTRNENPEISESLYRLQRIYSKNQLEANFRQLKSLVAFGVEEHVRRLQVDRPELRDLWTLFDSVYSRFQQWKLKSGQMDFNDLELYARKALSHPRVRSFFHQRFDLVLVDEFQDTNPIQGQILESFVRPSFENLCIVGDPKQSIYRFRDADVSVFQDLVAKLPSKHILDVNYRSVPVIIEFVNAVCAPLFDASGMDYEPLRAGKAPHQDDEDSEAKVFRLECESSADLARFLSFQMSQGRDLSEYVILARSVRREKTQKILESLDACGVPYLLGSGGRFYSDPRVRELISFLKGWTSPNHSLSQVAALRAPWVGISGTQLLAWKGDYFGHFFKHSEHPVALALRDAFLNRKPIRPGEVLEQIWDAIPEGSEMELPLATLWHKIENETFRGRRFEEIVNLLDRFVQEDPLEAEVPPPPAQGMVRIMTIHASKGLQFPRVILTDFEGEYKKPPQSNDFIWNRKKGLHMVIRDEWGDRDSKNELNQKWAEIENQAAVSESKRLFYVAITRAQEQLILYWKKEVNQSKTKEPSLASDHWRNWIELTLGSEVPLVAVSESNSMVVSNAVVSNSSIPESPVLTQKGSILNSVRSFRPRHSASEWMILKKCPLRYQKTFLDFEMDTEDPSYIRKLIVNEERFFESSAEKGLRIHQLLEHEDWDRLSMEFETKDIGQIVSEKIKEFIHEDGASDWQVYREVAFEVPFTDFGFSREALVGVMDRLEWNPTLKQLRIIDYKWTRKGKTTQRLIQDYQLQLELYVWSALKLLRISFKEIQIEVHLLQFFESGFQLIPVSIDFSKLEDRIQNQLSASHETLSFHLLNQEIQAQVGEHCDHCDYSKNCDSFQNSALRKT